MKLLSLLSLSALLTLSASAEIPRIPFPVSFSITASVQSSEVNSNSTTLSVPAFTKGTINTKELLSQIAEDEFSEGNYESETFPAGAKLVLLADTDFFEALSFVVEDKNGNLIVDVSDLLTLQPNFNSFIYSYNQSVSTGLYKPDVREFVGVITFDDTGAPDGASHFTLTQVFDFTTNDSLSSKHVLTESATLKSSAGTGWGTFGSAVADLTVSSSTASGKFTNP